MFTLLGTLLDNMCGIVGFFLKNEELSLNLGQYFSPMLIEMTDRGPDSAGIAVYRADGANKGKITAYHQDLTYDWASVSTDLEKAFNGQVSIDRIYNHVTLKANKDPSEMRQWFDKVYPNLRIMSAGKVLEIFKDIGLAGDVLARFGVSQMTGSHIIGHTRMATESAVTTEGAHPFNTGDDLCLVHNGSLSNHNRLRQWLHDKKGLVFKTENDTEVAAGYLTWRLQEGASIKEALEASLKDLDGFFTFAVGTATGFSILRDPIACKPAVIAETENWVAMSSEFRALARLPGIEKATVWEPKPATVYTWGTE